MLQDNVHIIIIWKKMKIKHCVKTNTFVGSIT